MWSINGGATLKHIITGEPGAAHTNPNVTFHYRIKGNKGHVATQTNISVHNSDSDVTIFMVCKNDIKREN